jgi:hypothetical protein
MKQSNQIRVGNLLYLAPMFVAVLAGSFFFRVPGSLLLVKLLVVPMFWLALRGLPTLYKNPIAEQPTLSPNVIEYYALFILLFAAFLLVVLWTPEFTVLNLLLSLFGVLLIGLPLKLWGHHRRTGSEAG